MALLSNRKEQIDKLRSRMKLIENLDGFAEGKQRLQSTSQKELQLLQKLEQEYNQKLSTYSTSYKSFMEEYQKGVNDVKKCKADCIKNILLDIYMPLKILFCKKINICTHNHAFLSHFSIFSNS